MSNNIVKHGQLEDIAGDLWTKAKKRDIERFEFDSTTKTLKGKNSVDTTLSIDVALTDLVSINDRAKFTKDVSVNDAGNTNNLYIGEINGNTSNNRILGYRGLTNKVFVDGYVEKLVIYMASDLAAGTQVPTKTWIIKKGATRAEDRVVKALHTGNGTNLQVETFMDNGTERKCVQIPVREEFSSEVYFMVKCPNHALQVCHNIKTQYRDDTINMSVEPSGTTDSTIDFGTNNPANTAIMHVVGRESITSLAEKLRKTQADGIVTKVNNIAPGADGNVVVNADNIKYNADTNAKTVKAVLDEKVSNITLKANDKKKLEITKANGSTSDVDLTEAFKANNVTYGKQIAGANKATVEDAIDALVAENGKSVKTIKNGRPDVQGNIDVTVAEGGATGITMTFGTTGGTPVQIATYMTTDEVNQIKALFV